MKNKTISVVSSHGVICMDVNGLVKRMELESDEISARMELASIISFDVEEYKKYYNTEELPDSIDILNLGYLYRALTGDNKYEDPSFNWREERGLIDSIEIDTETKIVMKTFVVESSWGELIIDEKGNIVELQNLDYNTPQGEVNYLPFITRFNLGEWKRINKTEELPEGFDILELSYSWEQGDEWGYRSSEEYYKSLLNKTI
jgi:hypothetical protein